MSDIEKTNKENDAAKNQVECEKFSVENQLRVENQAMLDGFSRGSTIENLKDIDADTIAFILQRIGDAQRLGSKVPEVLEEWIKTIDIEKTLEALLPYADSVRDPQDEESILVLDPEGKPSKEHILLESTMHSLDLISSALLVLSNVAAKQKFDIKHSPGARKLSKALTKKIREWKKITTLAERQAALGNRKVLGQIQTPTLFGSKYPKLLE